MSGNLPKGNIEPINLTESGAKQYVQDALAPEGFLRLSGHARDRMEERGIVITQIRDVLKQSVITEGPYKDTQGRWNCRFEGYAAGEGLCVIVGFGFNNGVRVVVVTAFEVNNYR